MLRGSKPDLLFDSWVHVLSERRHSAKVWLIEPEDPIHSDGGQRLSYRELYEQASFLAGTLVKLGIHRDDPVVLVFENGSRFCFAYFAVLLSGAVAIPVPPPSTLPQGDAYQDRLTQVLGHCRARWIIGDRGLIRDFGVVPGDVRVVAYDALLENPVGAPYVPEARALGDLAMIQYTSGTTGVPRGVELTHGNLLHNVHGIVERLDPFHCDTALTWLPMFHDMGLIGNMLAAVYSGVPMIMMRPRDFIHRPEVWLWAISRFRATISAAPNFAYKLCTQRIKPERVDGVDLGSWTAALNGAESVDFATVSAFERRFCEHGLVPEVTLPVYGLAENTVGCCHSERGEGAHFDVVDRESLERGAFAISVSSDAANARRVVSVGRPLAGQDVRIASPTGSAEEREIGEIEIGGSSVMRGYHRDATKTSTAISADGWLRTGDRGYIADGRLYVLGRLSDIIKRAGVRYDAADVEAAARRISEARGRIAVFGVFSPRTGTEDLVILVESETSIAERARLQVAVRGAIYERLGVHPEVVRIVDTGSIPRTTSGKVNNQAARTEFCGAENEPQR